MADFLDFEGVDEAILENEIHEIEESIRETEQLIQDFIAQRDSQREELRKLINKRERAIHASKMICNTLNIDSSSMVSNSTSSALKNGGWSDSFDWDAKVKHILEQVFHCKNGFRLYQREVINATIAGHDCFVVMRTGGGKSLCYQLPAMLQGGLTLVVSPLLSLISDQVLAMNKRSPGSAASLTSATDRSTAASIHRCFKGSETSLSDLRLVYVTPERVSKSKQLIAALEAADKAKRLTRFVIDEAHCCSQWGHDFRADYSQLHILKQLFPHVPLIALTATAPPQLAQDVQQILKLTKEDCVTFRSPSNRANLYYEVLSKPSNDEVAVEVLVQWMVQHGFYIKNRSHSTTSSGIVYCYSRKEADTLATSLQSLGISSGAYHAGCEDVEKQRVHQAWLAGRMSVVTATVAFGLGIDKPDVRFVAHFCLPKSAEAYYQESGRAGRDGAAARVALFFNPGDGIKMASLCHTDRAGVGPLRAMQSYAMGRPRCCRRRFLANSLGDSTQEIAAIKCSSCDVCCQGTTAATPFVEETENNSDVATCPPVRQLEEWVDVSKEACIILQVVQNQADHAKKVTFKQLIEETGKLDRKLRKESLKKLKKSESLPSSSSSSSSILANQALTEWLCAFLFLEDVLCEDYHYTAYSTIIYIKKSFNSSNVRNGVKKVRIAFPIHLSNKNNDKLLMKQPQTQKEVLNKKKRNEFDGIEHKNSKKALNKKPDTAITIDISDSDDSDESYLLPLNTSYSKRKVLKSDRRKRIEKEGEGDYEDDDDFEDTNMSKHK